VKDGSHLRARPVRIVALGGGTGLSTVLRGLKQHIADPKRRIQRPISDLAAVVTVTDDGGSSGRLRRDYRVLPPGDIRNCMVALSKDEDLLGKLFQYRFSAGRGLAGHSFGNLFLTALTNITGDFPEAVRVSSQVLATRGRIFPSTTQNVTLEAELEDGSIVAGETRISGSKQRIHRIHLVPRRVRPLAEVLAALHDADLILVGPGSLYTSIIPNLLVEGVTKAIARSIYEHTRLRIFDCAVINRTPASPQMLRRYRAQGAEIVKPSLGELKRMGLPYITADLLQQRGKIRHDTVRLANLLLREFVTQDSRK
jgi:2-phospho-L-lactate transferase/gluconeogenesis factor (CofD/UPF0052 family)